MKIEKWVDQLLPGSVYFEVFCNNILPAPHVHIHPVQYLYPSTFHFVTISIYLSVLFYVPLLVFQYFCVFCLFSVFILFIFRFCFYWCVQYLMSCDELALVPLPFMVTCMVSISKSLYTLAAFWLVCAWWGGTSHVLHVVMSQLLGVLKWSRSHIMSNMKKW